VRCRARPSRETKPRPGRPVTLQCTRQSPPLDVLQMSHPPPPFVPASSANQPVVSPKSPGEPPLLDPQDSAVESPAHPQTGPSGYPELTVAWRHTCWFRDRNRVYEAMCRVGLGDARLQRFAACGVNAWILRSADGPTRLRIAASYCHDRWCVPCGRAKARLYAANLRALIADVPHRFITLTLRAVQEPLADRLQHLYDSFRRLRQQQEWKSAVVGGVAMCEPVWSKRSNCWHVHLHVIAHGRFLAAATLSKMWLKATGDSFIVDIRLIHGHDKAVDYVCKYACKPLTSDTYAESDRLHEAMVALRGRRLCLPFGDWSHVRLSRQNELSEWLPVAPLGQVILLADAGDAWAIRVLALLRGEEQCQKPALWPDPP